MNETNKQLLLKDLCARLPYGVKCKDWTYDKNDEPVDTIDELDTICVENKTYKYKGIYAVHSISRIKPYLRPMSSMTEEERKSLKNILPCSMSFGITYGNELKLYHDYEYDGDYYFSFCTEILDWLNEHHFDYRGLIEKGLALEAPAEMYKEE